MQLFSGLSYSLKPEIKNTGAVPFIAKFGLTVVSGLDLPFHRAATYPIVISIGAKTYYVWYYYTIIDYFRLSIINCQLQSKLKTDRLQSSEFESVTKKL